MVLASMSPLFILWAFRGNDVFPNRYFIPFYAFMDIFPNFFLLLRLRTAIRLNEKRDIRIGRIEDHRDHLLVYLFAILLPFYSVDLNTWIALLATMVAVTFAAFLFWHLNLHYLNLLFAVREYRVFTAYPPDDGNPFTGKNSFILITKRAIIEKGEGLIAYRIIDTVYMEIDCSSRR